MPNDRECWGSVQRSPSGDLADMEQDPGEDAPVDAAVVGCHGVVTIRIPGGESPGEVRVYVRGTYELFVAYTVEALNVGNRVFVHQSRGGRAVDVTSIFTELL
ncbi:MAG: Membrane protein implicated in regulation of rane protease [Actinomycetota bacterium]|nr:Membrane protein implicated in regulation of rane protease [Actinomycetota bacterium]